ncbi:MAG TPA: amidohydrolase family protein [Steroidobacteraceae bacterium]|nr:amidohydrolase family protein [Steroidobacteraceae bacterium]
MRRVPTMAWLVPMAALWAAGPCAVADPAGAGVSPAELVVTHARIYTAATPETAEAMAVRDGQVVYVGDAAGVRPYLGRHTRSVDAGGRLVLPGLVDSHIHPVDMVSGDECDLRSGGRTLREISAFVRGCIERFRPAPGQWLDVYGWAVSFNNTPDPQYPTLRAALDKAAPRNPVYLFGDDGHRAAFNSAALALARNAAGVQVGLSARTLASDFSAYRLLIGVDAEGEPNGEVNEDAQYLVTRNHLNYNELDRALAHPEQIPLLLNRAGITAVLDAATAPEGLPVYERLLASGRMTMRATLAQYFNPRFNRDAQGRIDYAGMVARALAVRARYAANPLLRADFIKLFADGVSEGNPFATPPTLGNAAMLQPYLQPIFTIDADGHPSVTGYVDTDSSLCRDVRAHAERYQDSAAFMQAHGFHPGQCNVSAGKLTDDPEVIAEMARRMHLAGFNLHIHVIGDRAARVAIDAIEAARAADGNRTTHDSLAHLQFVQPDDLVRIGRDGLYVACTFSWASSTIDYDMTIVPFVQRVSGNSYENRLVPGSYYYENSYPFRGVRDAGGIVVGGSDAPVGNRDPIPFVNISAAVLRSAPGGRPLNPGQSLPVREALQAYTISGARFLGREREFGSLEVGKSADFIIVDRDVLALADAGKAADIAGTRVLETWFRGRRVYRAATR